MLPRKNSPEGHEEHDFDRRRWRTQKWSKDYCDSVSIVEPLGWRSAAILKFRRLANPASKRSVRNTQHDGPAANRICRGKGNCISAQATAPLRHWGVVSFLPRQAVSSHRQEISMRWLEEDFRTRSPGKRATGGFSTTGRMNSKMEKGAEGRNDKNLLR